MALILHTYPQTRAREKPARPPVAWRSVAWQAGLLAACTGLAIWMIWSAWHSIHAAGIAGGFQVFLRQAGLQINSPFLTLDAQASYGRVLFGAFLNTLGVSAVSIALALVFGVLLGMALVSRNKMLSTAGAIYVEVFRNIPLILQAVFWYATFTRLPSATQNPPSLGKVLYLTNKGLFIAQPAWVDGKQVQALLLATAMLAVFALVWGLLRWRTRLGHVSSWIAAATAMCSGVLLQQGLDNPIVLLRPVLQGFNYAGGIAVPQEFVVLCFSCVVFGSAYIAEILRGGLQSVPRGQVEAAQALGLPGRVVFFRVRVPIALRSMMPALSNIFLFIVKAAAVGAAIGYADLYAVTVIGITQTGQTVEFLLLMMLAYFALNYSISQGMGWIDRKIAFKGNPP